MVGTSELGDIRIEAAVLRIRASAMPDMSRTLARTESEPLLHKPRPEPSDSPCTEPTTRLQSARRQARHFLNSKAGHYAVLLLVSIDVSLIFADFILTLWVCEHTCRSDPDSRASHGAVAGVARAQALLGVVSLVFSYLFMAELALSVAAFGLPYFRSAFHCFDAFVIVAGFVLDVFLAGVLEEIGSIVVVLRLWRVVKIIEELSSEAVERIDAVQEELAGVKEEREGLRVQVELLRRRGVRTDGADEP